MKSRLALLAALSVLVTCLVAATAPAAQAATFSARLSRNPPLVNEVVKVQGAVPPATRPVQLQTSREGRWVRVSTMRAGSRGAFAFNVRATATAVQYRVYAPSATVNRRRVAAVYSNVVTATGVAGSLALSVAPAPVGPTTSNAASLTPGRATFTPARPGSSVSIQRWAPGGTWSTVTTGKQDAAGRFSFKGVDAGAGTTPRTFRAVSNPGNGAWTTTSSNVTPKYLPIVFADDFSSSSASAGRWVTRTEVPGGKRTCAQSHPSMASVANGVMTLRAQKVRAATRACPYGFWHNGIVTTQGSAEPFTAKYGMYAARIKFQAARGSHGAFWMQQTCNCGGSEIDVQEYFGAGRPDFGLSNGVYRALGSGAHGRSGGPVSAALAKSILGRDKTPANSWHVYSVEWTPTNYVFRIDGIPTFATNKYVSHVPSEMILSLATSDWELPSMQSGSRPAMQIDWVRGWNELP